MRKRQAAKLMLAKTKRRRITEEVIQIDNKMGVAARNVSSVDLISKIFEKRKFSVGIQPNISSMVAWNVQNGRNTHI